MRKAVIEPVVLIAVAAIPWLGCPIAPAGEKSAAVGRVGVGKHEATVEFHDASAAKKLYHVTLAFAKPVEAPGVKVARIQVWLLGEYDSAFPALGMGKITLDGARSEDTEVDTFQSKAVFSFYADAARSQLAAIVVAIDGEPKLFKLPPPRK
jgi:hypothetical protein